jgi:hypothetical protein
MGAELYINDRLIDLGEAPIFPLTFSVIELTDISKRSGAKSKTVTIPGTQQNCQYLSSIYTLDVATNPSGNQSDFINFDPTVKADARYYQNGLLQFKGIGQLLSCAFENGTWRFEISLISDIRDFIAEMAKLKINELDFSEYNHTLNMFNVEQTWAGFNQIDGSNTPIKAGSSWFGIGYYYGLIDYGFDRVSADTFGIDQMPLQVFIYGILQKLFEKVGLTWNSDFLESDLFKRQALAYQGGQLPAISPGQADNDSAFTTETPNGNGYIITGLQAFDVNPYSVSGSNLFFYDVASTFSDWVDGSIVQDNLNQIDSLAPTKFKCLSQGLFNFNYYGRHVVDLDFFLNGASISFVNGNYSLNLTIFKNGAVYSQETVYSAQITSTALSQSLIFDFNYSRSFNADINDQFTIGIRLIVNMSSISIAGYSPNTSISYGFNVSTYDTRVDFAKQIQELTPGSTVFLSTILPDLPGDVFFNGICKMFNLLVSPSSTDSTRLEIEPLISYYLPSDQALNWTDKLDTSQLIEVIPSINFASKNYRFRFADDDDYYNKLYFDTQGGQYGSFELNAQNQWGTNDTVYQLPFAQKVLVNIPINDTTFTGIIVPRTFIVNSDSNVEPKQGKPFIVQVGNLRSVPFRVIDEASATNTFSEYPYVGHVDDIDNPTFDLNFGVPKVFYWSGAQFTSNNLYQYHEQFIKEMISRFGKLLKASIHLNSSDIFQLDFQYLIQINGVIYRLQKILDYNSADDNSTKVELLKYIS